MIMGICTTLVITIRLFVNTRGRSEADGVCKINEIMQTWVLESLVTKLDICRLSFGFAFPIAL